VATQGRLARVKAAALVATAGPVSPADHPAIPGAPRLCRGRTTPRPTLRVRAVSRPTRQIRLQANGDIAQNGQAQRQALSTWRARPSSNPATATKA
jgi:hypothetical protein